MSSETLKTMFCRDGGRSAFQTAFTASGSRFATVHLRHGFQGKHYIFAVLQRVAGLPNGSLVKMAHSPKPVTAYSVSRGDKGNDISVNIHAPELRSENLSLTTWGSSFVLANQLHNIEVDRRSFTHNGIDILELGAGTGLVGLSGAVIWKGGVVLSDLSGIVPGLAQNIQSNQEILVAAGVSATCGSLDWNKPTELHLQVDGDGILETLSDEARQAAVVLAADCIYDSDHPEMLANTIFAWLRPGERSRAIIAYPLRVAYLDAIRDMWERLEAGGLILIQEGREDAGEEFEDETLIEWCVWKWKNE
jgi:predicted nicotinamide N-methyase